MSGMGVIFATCQRLPVFSSKRTSSASVGISQGCHERKSTRQTLCSCQGPRYKGLNGSQLRMAAPVHDVEAVPWQRHVRHLHKGSARKFGSDQHVAANRNPLSRDSGLDGVKLLAKVQADQTGKIGNVLVVLSGGGLPLSPGWRLHIPCGHPAPIRGN
jgi:hypothetical protein